MPFIEARDTQFHKASTHNKVPKVLQTPSICLHLTQILDLFGIILLLSFLVLIASKNAISKILSYRFLGLIGWWLGQ